MAFVDSSVVLRLVLGEPGALIEWSQVKRAYASALLPVEIGRVIDRMRLGGSLDDEALAQLHEQIAAILGTFDIVAVSSALLRRAAGPLPTALGTLDAIHLVTALYVARQLAQPLVLATHDRQLGRAARACGLRTIGVEGR